MQLMSIRSKRKNVIYPRTIFIKLIIALIVFLILVLSLKQIYKFDFKKPILKSESLTSSEVYLEKIPTRLGLKNLSKEIRAEAYLIYDLNNGKVIAGKEENDLFPIASITKLMTAYVALSDCADEVKIFIDSLLIASDNEASEKIAKMCPNREEFLYRMNYYSKKNKLNLTFTNPSGLDDEANDNEVSNWGDAVSVAKLINLLGVKNKNLLYHTTLREYKNIQNTNALINQLPFITGSKTGFTDSAGGNLVTIYDIGTTKEIAIVVFNSTREERFTDTIKLLRFYLNSL